MKINESICIMKNLLNETEKWKNTEEDAYIELDTNGVVGQKTDNEVFDYGTFRGFDKRGDTIYLVMEYDGTVYVYSIDSGFPFIFNKVSE